VQHLNQLVHAVHQIDPQARIHMHVSEQTREVDDCLAFCGQRPMQWLLSNAAVDQRWCLIHATHLTPEETTALAQSQAVTGLCPTTEGNLGDGIFPFESYRTQNGRWGIGGDSHVSRDPFEELRLNMYNGSSPVDVTAPSVT
jgi:formimidoylglutamate deiminase